MNSKNDAVRNAVIQLALAKQMQAEIEELKSKAAEVLIPFMSASKTKSLKIDGVEGSVAYVAPSIVKKFNKEKAAQELLSKGVNADVIQASYEAAIKNAPRSGYIKFIVNK